MATEKEIMAMLPGISNIFNYMSCVSSALVLLIFSTIMCYEPRLVNRVTLRLQVGISLFDFLNAVFALHHHTVKSGPFCIFLGFWRNFGEQIYCFLNMSIALNLQLFFIHGLKPTRKWEVIYWVGPLVASSILSFIPLGLNMYGLATNKLCYMDDTIPGSKLLTLLNTSVVYLVAFIYLAIISTLVITKLRNDKKIILSMSHYAETAALGSRKDLLHGLKRTILKISLYPLAALFGLSGFIVGYLYQSISGKPNLLPILIWGMIGITTKGFINFLTFLLDINIQKAIIELYYNAKQYLKSKRRSQTKIDSSIENNIFPSSIGSSYNNVDSSNSIPIKRTSVMSIEQYL
ncbi:hypothetical protein K502DRAFT_327890 [Neoconidiobolus thromboides FSU 785]|nr:hypothetical protein K502DRAFT_327890 [Neoconidiobolus thromboides FSU 785]